MALVCISFSQLGIQLVSESIHFHESCHSFESCPLSHCVSPRQVNAAKSLVMPPDVQSEVMLIFYTYSQNKFLHQLLLSQSYGYIILKITEFCSEFRVVDLVFFMALLRRDYSCRLQFIIQELVLETN